MSASGTDHWNWNSHLIDEIDLAVLLALLHERALDDAEEVARGRVEPRLLLHFAHQRLASRLAELDVPPGEVRVAAVLRQAEEDLAVPDAHAACDCLNVLFHSSLCLNVMWEYENMRMRDCEIAKMRK